MYVLDEPSIGLHQRDNDRLIGTLQHLRDIGNSVIVVEHDEDMIRAADHVIDMGPGAGIHGGRVMAQGSYEDVKATPASLTGQYLSGTKPSPCRRAARPGCRCWTSAGRAQGNRAFRPATRPYAAPRARPTTWPRAATLQEIRVLGATGNNLKNVSVAFPGRACSPA